jgi:hypothetical protein
VGSLRLVRFAVWFCVFGFWFLVFDSRHPPRLAWGNLYVKDPLWRRSVCAGVLLLLIIMAGRAFL